MIDGVHGEGPGVGAGTLLVLVAPVPGRLRVLPPRRFRGGHEWVEKGQPVARVEHGTDADVILAPVGGRMGGVLRRDGEPVTAGEPVAWMEASGEPRA